MSGFVDEVVCSVNAYVVLTDDQAEALIRGVLRNGAPGLVGIQEWDGPKPDLGVLARRAGDVDGLLERATRSTHHRFARAGAGGPQIWDSSRYDKLSLDAVQLVGAEFVGHLAGRKSRLPASVASVGIYNDRVMRDQTALIDVHLTAEVQLGRGYRRDPAHRLRVRRHRKERAAVERLVRQQQRAGRRVYVTGDTNFDSMPLPPLTACWVGHPRQEAAGTLGHRTVDYVYGPGRAHRVETLPTRSDHDAVVATYRRKESS